MIDAVNSEDLVQLARPQTLAAHAGHVLGGSVQHAHVGLAREALNRVSVRVEARRTLQAVGLMEEMELVAVATADAEDRISLLKDCPAEHESQLRTGGREVCR